MARQISYRAGLGESVPAMTINMACGSGLRAIDLAFRAVRDGDAEAVLAGGTESMSRVPYLLTSARWGSKMGAQEVTDGMYKDGFACPLAEGLMGETAERLAEIHSISREEQDAFALRSQQRATAAQAVLNSTQSIGELRKGVHSYRGTPVYCTYHPSYLLRNPAAKRDVWEDMKVVMRSLGVELDKSPG